MCKFSGCIICGYKVFEGAFEGPLPLQFPGSPKRPGQISVKYRSWYFASFLDCRYSFFSGLIHTVNLSFLKNQKERSLILWLLLASTFSELACLWFATWGLEFYWTRKASFFWTWSTEEREQLCLLSGWKMWRLLLTISVCVAYFSFLQGTLWHRRINIVHFWNKSLRPTRDTTFLIINDLLKIDTNLMRCSLELWFRFVDR